MLYTQESPIDSPKDRIAAREGRKDGRNHRRSDWSGKAASSDGSRVGKQWVTHREKEAREPQAQVLPVSELGDRPATERQSGDSPGVGGERRKGS